MAYTRPASPNLSGFSRPPGNQPGTNHSARLAAAAARSRTAACLTFPAAALLLYLAAYGLPWSSAGRGAANLTALDDGFNAAAAGPDVAAAFAADPLAVLQRPGAATLWDAANIPDYSGAALKATKGGKGRKKGGSALLRGQAKQLCAAVAPLGVGTIAAVGNGPLTDESRSEIAAADVIIRFNEMNNRLPGERLDVWFARHNYRQPAPFWGFWQLRNGSAAEPLIEQAAAVLLIGGDTESAQPLLETYPALEPKLFQADTKAYQRLYQDFFRPLVPRGRYPPDPSTGLLGLMQVLACTNAAASGNQDKKSGVKDKRRGPKVNVYGFNWSGKHWMTHQMKAEEGIVRRLVEPFGVEFHATACDGLRACEAACDVADFQIADAGDGEGCRQKAEAAKAAKDKEQPAAAVDEHVTDTVEEAVDMMPP